MASTKDRELPAGELFSGVVHAEKYQSGNWIAAKLVNGFMSTIVSMLRGAGSREVYEVGCGEGHILGILAAAGFSVRGCDVSETSLAVAEAEASKRGLHIPLSIKSIYDLDPAVDCCSTVICCEVLEHLVDPEAALQKLLSITTKDLIVSVPNEPIWHILNMARGKYLTALGNTPGHFQHWSKRRFVEFIGRHAEIVSIRTPLPWTVIHCRPRQDSI